MEHIKLFWSRLNIPTLPEACKQGGHLPLVQRYMLHVQPDNLGPVNEAINTMYVLEENFKGLRESIDAYNQFDWISLALQLEKHELLEFRRISAYLFKVCQRAW